MRLDELQAGETVTVALGIEWTAGGPIFEDLHTGRRWTDGFYPYRLADRNEIWEEHGGPTRLEVRETAVGRVLALAPRSEPAA